MNEMTEHTDHGPHLTEELKRRASNPWKDGKEQILSARQNKSKEQDEEPGKAN
jgi:hypothetical protein